MLSGNLTPDMCAAGLQASPCELLTFDPGMQRVLGASDRALQNLGYSFAELGRLPAAEIYCGSTWRAVAAHAADLLAGRGQPERLSGRHCRADGSGYDISVRLTVVDAPDPTILATAFDVSGQLAAEKRAAWARQNLQAAIEALPHGFVLYDAADRLVICNEQYHRYYPRSAAAMVPGARFEDILRHGVARGEYADAVGREEEWLAERLSKHRAADETVHQRLSDGRILQIIERRTPDGGRVGLRIDITEHVNSRERAERAEQRLVDAIRALPAGFWLFDADDRLVMFNERFREMYHTSADALEVGRSFDEILRSGLSQGQYPDAIGREEEWLAEVMRRRGAQSYELVYQLDDGRWIHSLNQPTSEGGLVGFRVDITELKQRQVELEQAASTDPLTGLLNRRGVADYLESSRRTIAPDERLCFLHIDLDKFKAVNDVLGHQSGDALLRHIAEILRRNVRPADLIARVGGDEFLICLRARGDDEPEIELAERVRRLISRPVPLNGKSCHVGASVGVATWRPGDSASPEEAMQDADIALNTSKANGRNQVVRFAPFMREHSVREARIAEDVVRGLENGEFTAFFQPQLDCASLRPGGFESLVRWRHPEFGILTPADFLPACETAGLTSAIDREVFDQALLFAAELDERGLAGFRVSVNVSSAQLKDPEIVDQYLWRIAAHGLTPRHFRVEILESTLLDQRVSHIVDNVRRFSAEGFLIELDDFGTGHTAIASLRKYPVDRIKIDRSLISGVDRDVELETLTDAVVSLGRRLGVQVLAEGIERQGEYETARRMGCTCVQGFLFARPMSREDCLAWLLARRDVASERRA